MSEEKTRLCDDAQCDADCESCEKAVSGIDIDKLNEIPGLLRLRIGSIEPPKGRQPPLHRERGPSLKIRPLSGRQLAYLKFLPPCPAALSPARSH